VSAAALAKAEAAHVPVLLAEVIEALQPGPGVFLDGTFGAGGYTRAMLDNGAERVIAIDRDPEALARAEGWRGAYGDRLVLVEGVFGDLDRIAAEAGAEKLQGVVLDIGVSSMQIDQPERGFSFQKPGPLDMRMGREGPTAADIVNNAEEEEIADILFHYGEERASRRIARAIVAKRREAPIVTTDQLSAIIERCLPRPKPGQVHPSTRSFQALRIAVNDELGELVRALSAAERALAPGGVLVVVTFHSLEDRIVKRFIQARSGGQAGSRHAPERQAEAARFAPLHRKAIEAGEEELARNPRARSARLRAARRLEAPAGEADPHALGLPRLGGARKGGRR
jgi:16S rRNA (cytosine1402-N4)-methyltransferase